MAGEGLKRVKLLGIATIVPPRERLAARNFNSMGAAPRALLRVCNQTRKPVEKRD